MPAPVRSATLDLHVATFTSALDLPPSVWHAWRRSEAAANIMYPHARAAYNRELAGAPPTPDQLWIVLSSVRETPEGVRAPMIDFVLSCTEWAMGNYPIFLFCNNPGLDGAPLKTRIALLVSELRANVPVSRVYSIFAPTRVAKAFARTWTASTGMPLEDSPYYSAVFTYCTRATITRRRQTLVPDALYTVRPAEEADIRAVAVLCQGFASTSEPFILDEAGALKEATYLVRNRLVYVHDIEMGGVREIASIVCVTRQSDNVVGITKVFTSPHIRKRGCAERLVRYVCQRMLIKEHKSAVVLYVAHNNPAASKVYHRVGFQGLTPDVPRPEGVEDWLELGFVGADLGHW